MNPRQLTRIPPRFTRAMILTCTGTLLGLMSSQASAQTLSANAVEVQGTPLFSCSLRVTADVPSLFANRTHDAIVTLPRNTAATKPAGNSHSLSQSAVLTTTFASDTTSFTKASSFSFASCMLQHSTAKESIALPPNSAAANQLVVQTLEVTEATMYQPMDVNKDGTIDFFDYLDFIQELSTTFDNTDRVATSP